MARRSSDSELGIQSVSDGEASLKAKKGHGDSNPFEAHRQGPSGFDETEYKGLREMSYDRRIASRAILGIGGQVIDFDYLYQLDIIHLQNKLAQDYSKLCTEGSASETLLEEIHEHLKVYSTTLKDYEDMLARTPKRVPPNWNLLDIFYPSLGLMKHREKTGNPSAMHWMKSRSVRGYAGHTDYAEKQQNTIQQLQEMRRQRVIEYSDKLNRFFVALFGGVAVVVPMLVMSVRPTQTKSLVTVSVSVLLVALVVALLSKASYQELIMATAAYAAVLVVFVGSGVVSV